MKKGPKNGHKMSYTRIYRIYAGAIQRCRNVKNPYYKRYGARGIKFLWEDFNSFYKDMAQGYKKNLTLDRIDNNGNYCKKNCRWATRKEQQRNREMTVSFQGLYAKDIADKFGCKGDFVTKRIRRGWNVEKAFTTPPKINQWK